MSRVLVVLPSVDAARASGFSTKSWAHPKDRDIIWSLPSDLSAIRGMEFGHAFIAAPLTEAQERHVQMAVRVEPMIVVRTA